MVLKQIQPRILKLKKYVIMYVYKNLSFYMILGYAFKTGMRLICRYYFISICFEEANVIVIV